MDWLDVAAAFDFAGLSPGVGVSPDCAEAVAGAAKVQATRIVTRNVARNDRKRLRIG